MHEATVGVVFYILISFLFYRSDLPTVVIWYIVMITNAYDLEMPTRCGSNVVMPEGDSPPSYDTTFH